METLGPARAACGVPLLAAALLLVGPPASAECAPPGTAKADTIECSGSDTAGVTAYAGDDRISVLPDQTRAWPS